MVRKTKRYTKKKKTKTKKRDPWEEHPLAIFARRAEQAAKNDPRLADLWEAANRGDVTTVKKLLKLGLDPTALPPDEPESAVFAAVYGNHPEVVKLLARAGADLNDGWPNKPLATAARRGQLEVVRALIAGGADVNLPDDAGDTPLDCAVTRKHVHLIDELLRAGADPNFVSDENRRRGNVHTPLECAAYDPPLLEVFLKHGFGKGKDFKQTLLSGAIARGDLDSVKRLVNDEGADVNAPGKRGQSPLMLAASRGKLAIVKFLVFAGANVDQRFRAQRRAPALTALDYAKHARQSGVVKYLLEVRRKRETGAGRKTPPRRPRPTGVPTFSVNDTCVLLESPVDQAARALAKHLCGAVHEESVLGKRVKLTGRCFAIFRMVGQPWSAIMRLNCEDVSNYLKPGDGAVLSKSLKSRAMVVTAGKTSAICQYITFDSGKPVEIFDTGSAADDTDRATIRSRFIKWYDVDLDQLANVEISHGIAFASSLRTLKRSQLARPLEFIQEHLKKENAFVPFFGQSWGRAGETVELTIEGLGPDDIERLDYVAVK